MLDRDKMERIKYQEKVRKDKHFFGKTRKTGKTGCSANCLTCKMSRSTCLACLACLENIKNTSFLLKKGYFLKIISILRNGYLNIYIRIYMLEDINSGLCEPFPQEIGG